LIKRLLYPTQLCKTKEIIDFFGGKKIIAVVEQHLPKKDIFLSKICRSAFFI